jgi:molecular chaperone GrpE
MDQKNKSATHKKEKNLQTGPTIDEIIANSNQVEIDSLVAQKTELENKLKDQEQKILRLYADIDNIHKQQVIEISGARKTGKRSIASSVVELINTINLSFSFVPSDADEKFVHYVSTLKTSLAKAQSELDAVGLTILIPAIGDEFDATTMQALNASEKLKVAQVVSVGYSIDGQIIAPAVIMLG